MADKIQLRRDTAARWKQYNPILLEGEIGLVTDDANQYKVGDGVSYWNDLPLRGFNGNIVQTKGDATNAVICQKAVTEWLYEILDDRGDGSRYDPEIKAGYYWDWNTNAEAVDDTLSYATKMSVSKNDILIIQSTNISKAQFTILYYDNDDTLLKKENITISNRFSFYCWESGYIRCNFARTTYIVAYKVVNSQAVVNQLANKLSIAYGASKPYALIWNDHIRLNIADATITIPANCYISGNNVERISFDDDIVIKKSEIQPNWGSSFIILNKLGQARAVEMYKMPDLGDNEFLICALRWSECIYDGNFRKYYLNDTLIDLKPSSGINDVIVTSATDFDDGYYVMNTINVGDIVTNDLSFAKNVEEYGQAFKSFKFIALANSTITIYGKGGKQASRLYCVIDKNTREVLHVAEASEDTRTSPKVIKIITDCDVYITNENSNGSVEYKASIASISNAINNAKTTASKFVDYIGLVPSASTYPVLNTTLGTLTLKSGSHFFGNGVELTITNDIVVDKGSDSYGSHFVILNKDTQTARVVAGFRKVTLADNETVVCLVRWNDRIIQCNFFKYYLNDTLIDLKPIDNGSNVVAPKMYNPPIDFKKEQLYILDIGNSYTDDATHYLDQIVRASGVSLSNICLYKAVRGGASFKSWYDVYHNADSSEYYISKVTGDLNVELSGASGAKNGERFRNLISNQRWDLIIIHQVSTYAPYFERWEENSNAGYLSKFIRLLRKHQPGATLGFYLVHSYWGDYTGNNEKSSIKRWQLIAESVKKLRANYGIDLVIPYGTAIQNVRASSYNNDYDLTADGTHCADGLADYTAACTYFQTIFAPRYNVSVLGNSARVVTSKNETYASSDVDVTDETAEIAQLAALSACYNWYECTNPETLIEENLID